MKLRGTMKVNLAGHLEIGGYDAVQLARDFGTPLYVMDEAMIREICGQYRASFIMKHHAEVFYASKAFLTMAMCRIIEQEGLGLDVVSGGELYTAIKAKFPPGRICFHGNNKQLDELRLALEYGVGRIVVDNYREIEMLGSLAEQMGRTAEVLLRVSPGVEAHTHEYIKTGQIDSKFGFTVPNGQALDAVKRCLAVKSLELRGIHCHIGSQVFEMESFGYTAGIMMELARDIYRETGLEIKELNLGGGFGIYYAEGDEPSRIEKYAEAVTDAIARKAGEYGLKPPRLMIEPGRSIVGEAGTTLYTVGSTKEIPGVRKYVAVDGGMSDNPRHALYQARYEACLANRMNSPAEEKVAITGKCCESGDMLIWDLPLPKVEAGDILAVACTGAYNYSMSMNYNRLCRPAVVLVQDGAAEVIVERENYEDLLRNDRIPKRLRQAKPVRLASRR
ncbi:MAG: diaminopimelate decarboxylase [Firmicutes bacterium]|nr:diaminopimelate decarboxylase [Bacillota bacterium]